MGIHRSIVVFLQLLDDRHFRIAHTLRAPLQSASSADGSLRESKYLPERVSERAWSDSLPCTKEGKGERAVAFFSLSLSLFLFAASTGEFMRQNSSLLFIPSFARVYFTRANSSHVFCPRILFVQLCGRLAAEARKQQRRRRLQGSLRSSRLCRLIVDEAAAAAAASVRRPALI